MRVIMILFVATLISWNLKDIKSGKCSNGKNMMQAQNNVLKIKY